MSDELSRQSSEYGTVVWDRGFREKFIGYVI